MATAGGSDKLGLLDFPNEVLRLVVEELIDNSGYVPDNSELQALRATCKQALHITEPVFWRCITVFWATDRKFLEASLAADLRRVYYAHTLDLTHTKSDLAHGQAMLRYISRFPNIRCLRVAEDGTETKDLVAWLHTLNEELEKHPLPELREFQLFVPNALVRQREHHVAASVENLLQAPRLERMTLWGVDLQDFQGRSPERCAPLKKLALFNCLVDERSMSLLLSKPSALQKLSFGPLETTAASNPRLCVLSLEETVRTTKLILHVVADAQPGLKRLKISLVHGGELLASEEHKGVFDYKPFVDLQKLSIKTMSHNRHAPPTCQGMPAAYFLGHTQYHSMWTPVNLFSKLPPNIEQLKIECEGWGWGIDLDALADALLAAPSTQSDMICIPQSLKHLEFVIIQQEHQRPLNQDAQARDDKLRRGINRLMTGLSLSRLEVEQDQVLTTSSHVIGYYLSHRKLITKKKTAAEQSKEVASGGKRYDLEEVTWLE